MSVNLSVSSPELSGAAGFSPLKRLLQNEPCQPLTASLQTVYRLSRMLSILAIRLLCFGHPCSAAPPQPGAPQAAAAFSFRLLPRHSSIRLLFHLVRSAYSLFIIYATISPSLRGVFPCWPCFHR